MVDNYTLVTSSSGLDDKIYCLVKLIDRISKKGRVINHLHIAVFCEIVRTKDFFSYAHFLIDAFSYDIDTTILGHCIKIWVVFEIFNFRINTIQYVYQNITNVTLSVVSWNRQHLIPTYKHKVVVDYIMYPLFISFKLIIYLTVMLIKDFNLIKKKLVILWK